MPLPVKPKTFDHYNALYETIPTKAWGPNLGASRDCGYDKALSFNVDNLHDHQTRRSSPSYEMLPDTNALYHGWQLLRVEPIFLGNLLYGAGVDRLLQVAPTWRSVGVVGPAELTYLRISLSGYLPKGSGFVNIENQTPGYEIKQPAVTNTWSFMTTNDSFTNCAPAAFSLAKLNGHRSAFLIVEGWYTAQIRALYRVTEGERFEI